MEHSEDKKADLISDYIFEEMSDIIKARAYPIIVKQRDELLQENEKVKRLLHNLTPGGSEFFNDPEYCAKWIRESREENHYGLSKIIKELKEENTLLKEQNRLLKEALTDLADCAEQARSILQSESSPSRGYWGVLDTQEAREALNKVNS